MSQIHLIGGEKGGVGKSLVARLLAQYFIDRQLPFSAFDTDRSHGALLRFYSDYASAATLDREDSLDGIVEAATEPGRRVLVDLAAQTLASLTKWLEDSGVQDVTQELGIGMRYWHVMDAGRDSADLLVSLLDGFGARMPLVLVLNELRGEQFDILAASGQLERAQALGAAVMTMRKLPDSTMQKIDGHSTSFWAAVNVNNRGSASLGLLERQRVKVWMQRVYADFDRIGV